MNGLVRSGLLALAFVVATPSIAATSINPALASPTSLGMFAAGHYRITATGLIDLLGPVGSGFTLRPDGVPDTGVTDPAYAYFNPAGSTTDIVNGGSFGVAGAAFNIGSLVGSFTATPGTGDFFAIGFGTVVTLAAPGSIYAMVNDTYFPNNGGSFLVDVNAVPEPAIWAMLIAGFAFVGAAQRRRRLIAA